MSIDFNDILKQGLVKTKSKRLRLWKSKWLILRSASSKGPLRLEKYADEKSSGYSDESSKHWVDLTHMIDVRQQPADGRNAVIILFASQTSPFQFSPENDEEASGWFEWIKKLCPSAAVPGNTIQRYKSNSAQGVFHVYLLPTPNLTAHGECLLKVTTHNVHLYDSNSQSDTSVRQPVELTRWPLSSLRRYGRDNSKFTIETGRSSPTGEGLFVFNSYQSELIYQAVNKASTTIAETLRVGRSIHQNGALNTYPGTSSPPSRLPMRHYANVSPAGREPPGDRRPLPPPPAV